MRLTPDGLILSATDVSNSLACGQLTGLDLSAVLGERKRPFRPDPLADILRERGLAHEKAYVDWLRAQDRDVVDLRDEVDREAATLDAMRAGREVIVQGSLRDGPWMGMPDVLLRISRPGSWTWSYEAVDTKLAQETRGGTILQLGLYSELLTVAQGVAPEHFHVVSPKSGPLGETYRASDYAAYVRFIRRRLQSTIQHPPATVLGATYPEPVDHCDVCAWFRGCEERRRDDDHLSLVAGASRSQRRELSENGIATLTALAGCGGFDFKLKRGAMKSLLRTRDQARVQHASRGLGTPLHELRPSIEKQGLRRLPEPDPGDVFLDLEGDPFGAEGGREYLFGVATAAGSGEPAYRAWWATTHEEEGAAFGEVMDFIEERRARYPSMHIYHYAHYEPTAFKKLAGRHAAREDALDRLLRGDHFVDLYDVVRQSLVAGVERYSIKNLEPLYGFARAVPLEEARFGLRAMERSLETGAVEISEPIRRVVEGYNRDDCVSTLRLRDWLESIRATEIAKGVAIPRPAPEDSTAPEKVTERTKTVEELRARLLDGVPTDKAGRSEEEQARWLLAYMLDWHRREDKAAWWEYFRLKDLPEEDLYDERQAVAGLEFLESVPEAAARKANGGVVHRYRYPIQEMEIRVGDKLKTSDGKEFGSLEDFDRASLTVDIRKRKARESHHPSSVFAHMYVNPEAMEQSLLRIARTVLDRGIDLDSGGKHAVARRLLAARAPRLRSADFHRHPEEDAVAFAVRCVSELDDSVLAIQGPPGAGKTYTGAKMIRELVRRGRKVGVIATSHKVILNLLDGVLAAEPDTPIRVGHRGDADDVAEASPAIAALADNKEARSALASGAVSVLGGTAWMWSREEFTHAVDVLFVDEAGQMSLANVIAASQAASSVVLLGDPQQLEQPIKGSHPEGVEVSALGHMLGDHLTLPPDRGIFLPITWRLAPGISAYTSELFYEDRLHSKPGLENQSLVETGDLKLDGAGLRFHEVAHDGNRSASEEEIAAIEKLVARLVDGSVRWANETGVRSRITGEEILVVAPYNAQVSRLTRRLAPFGARVGTVDKFQGQEAPIVIYSMATSRPEDAPRGMEFLYSLNRLNVATSRARCAAILVASPRLFEPECRTPRQMKLANALCRFREMAAPL